MKKLLAAILALTMVLGMVAAVYADEVTQEDVMLISEDLAPTCHFAFAKGCRHSLSVRACVPLPLQSIRCCLYKASCQFRVQKVFLKTYVSLVVNKYEHVSW